MAYTIEMKHGWNAFQTEDASRRIHSYGDYGAHYSHRPDRQRLYVGSERSIISSVYTRLAMDVAGVDVRHVRLDDQNRYLEDIESGLNDCLTVEANTDQAARAFRQDMALTLFDEGVIAIVPVDTTLNPNTSGGFDIKTLRCGKVVGWFPSHVQVSLYNEATGRREEIMMAKKAVAIVENPLYMVMNEPNSTLKRLITKLAMLDVVDDASASGKLDLIVQLPYTIRSEAKREQASQRRKDIEFQLKGSKYGIAYTDAAEKITQLNRPVENNLMGQIEYLVKMLYSQLGLTEEVMNGTAEEAAMLNYNNRTIKPIMDAIVEGMRRAFLTKTARKQGQSILYFRDPFALVPLEQVAELADKLARNEVVSSNEIRQGIGMKPRPEAKADELKNSNMPEVDPPADVEAEAPAGEEGGEDVMADAFDEIEAELDQALGDLGLDAEEDEDGTE